MIKSESCLFCDRNDPKKHTVIAENEHAYARMDNYPASPGHVEIVPKEHIVSYFKDLPRDVRNAMFDLLNEAQAIVEAEYHPDGYNIGINDGEAAGRTIHHLHLHLIPRYRGDTPNPRGGIRHVIAGKGDY